MKKPILLVIFLCCCLASFGQEENCACCTENHQSFDFWEGNWEVTNPDGTAAGKNSIVKLENGCILKENWTSASPGYTGTSTNFYNLRTKQWEQLWVDNAGNHLKLKGNRTANQMILSSDKFTAADGKKYVNRITWTANDNGTVRQHWEVLQKDSVVNVAFDGLYKKVD